MSGSDSNYSLNKRRLSHKRSVSLEYDELLSDKVYDNTPSDPVASIRKQLESMKYAFEERIEKIEKEVFKLVELASKNQLNFSPVNSKPLICVEKNSEFKYSFGSSFKEPKNALSSSQVHFLIRMEYEENHDDIFYEIKSQLKRHLQMTDDEVNSINILKPNKVKKTGVIFSVDKSLASDALKEKIKQSSSSIVSFYNSESSNSFTNPKKLFVKRTRLFTLFSKLTAPLYSYKLQIS